jgi:indolepyruvate ferredoxin oxidoreductase
MTLTDDAGTGRAELALDARYKLDRGEVYVTGSQALARLPVEQLRADRGAGFRSSAFVSGYQGSPLAGYDRDVRAAARAADDVDVVFSAGLNEELAATAVMGSQLAPLRPGARCDGVVGVWFGKAPGLDRASDAIRHAQYAGTHHLGGVVALVGDDPSCKSSTLPSSSDAALAELLVPFVVPGSLQDAIDLGRHAIAQSRASGLWSGMKIATALADAAGTVTLDPDRFSIVMPSYDVDGVPYVPTPTGRVAPPWSNALEVEVRTTRLTVARLYGAINALNRITHDAPSAWIGLVASGITYRETLEALRGLGLRSREDIAAAGIRVVELRQPWPVEPSTIRSLCAGLDEVVVIEEKHRLVELTVRDALYGRSDAPRVVGHDDDSGAPLIPSVGMLDADALRAPLRRRLEQRLGSERLAPAPVVPVRRSIAVAASRTPFFCSGCPHSQSTRVPEGSLVGAGIGCHGMVTLMEPERVGEIAGITCMGNEGAQWIGMAPFVADTHLFQNLGDGTYAHSGHLAIRAAVAAGVSMTYKLLFNDAVAMTGGQDAAGARSVPDIAHILIREGVQRIVITTDEPGRYRRSSLPRGAQVWDRSRIIEAQELLRSIDGVTVLIHDQQCAAEKRRDRKRGVVAQPKERVVINERVCEGCGDCGVKSNCLSVQPIATPFGRKTTIDQSSCNIDLTCIDGDCPSFATVTVDDDRTGSEAIPVAPAVPEPAAVVPVDGVTIRIPGIGGTGVVTLSQVIGTAALADGFNVFGLDQTGLAQKAGPVVSDVRISRHEVDASNKAASASVDLYLVCDVVVASTPANLSSLAVDRTVVVGSTTEVPMGSMVAHPDRPFPDVNQLRESINGSSRDSLNRWVDTGRITRALFGETSTANVFLLGVAYQVGALPISAAGIERALEINGVSVKRNIAAFQWGRAWCHDPDGVTATVMGATTSVSRSRPLPNGLATRINGLSPEVGPRDLVRMLAEDLAAYQSPAYATRFVDVIERVAHADERVGSGARFTVAASQNLHRLMAYKDEYEVARLLLAPEASRAATTVGGVRTKVTWHLHPPALKSIGLKRKIRLGPRSRPIMVALAAAKPLRGTALDPFGRAHVRRLERELRDEFIATLLEIADRVDTNNYDAAVAIAALPDMVRGYEELKVQRAAEYRSALVPALDAFRNSGRSAAQESALSQHHPTTKDAP